MDDNKSGWTGLHIPWKNMVDKLYHIIGKNHFRFSNDVVEIKKIKEKPCLFQIKVANGTLYHCNKVIVATTITGIQKLVPGADKKTSLYQQIHGQPFLRLYAKFNKESTEIMKKYVTSYTIVPGPLQKIIPIDANKGVYMIAYSDNYYASLQKKYLENTPENRDLYCDLLEESLGIPKGELKITAIKDFYWPIGTHYYEPLKGDFKTRNEFVQLLHSDDDVFNDMYSYVKQSGYGKSADDFSTLVGKKKVGIKPSSADGSLESAPTEKLMAGPMGITGIERTSKYVPAKEQGKQGTILNAISSLDKGFYKNLIGSPVKGLGTALEGVTGKGFVSDALIKFGDYFNKTIDELTPQDEEFKNSLTDQFGQAFGQVASLIVTGGAAGAAGKAGAAAELAAQVAPKGSAAVGAIKGIASE
jgi:hypothetical protein